MAGGFRQSVQVSSNVGMVRAMARMEREVYWEWLTRSN